VGGSEIAMEQAVRVQQAEGGGDVAQVATGFRVRKGRERSQVLTVEQLHRVEGAVLVDPVLVDLDDGRVTQTCERVVFPAKEQRRRFAFALEQALERHDLAGGFVAYPVHAAHAACCQRSLYAVASRDARPRSGGRG